jgi:hypothetical protein
MYVRHRLDLSVGDIFFGVFSCGRRLRSEKLEASVIRVCSLEEEGLVCFSVRSGWDLWLCAQGLRAGDEVLVSAITHPAMIRIIQEHGLRAVPVDIDPGTLAPRPWMLEAALTPRTRVVLVAHLFGGRMDLGGIAKFARDRGLLLVEDCAQAFQGPKRMGDPAADVSMYSFGTLKTSTALGGSVLRVGDLHPGQRSTQRTHWLFPVVVEDPEALVASLRRCGLDASRATSNIAVVEASAGRSSPTEASLMMSGVEYLPVYPELSSQALDVMAGLVNDCAARGAAERVAL